MTQVAEALVHESKQVGEEFDSDWMHFLLVDPYRHKFYRRNLAGTTQRYSLRPATGTAR